MADEGQMWIATAHTFSFFREIESYSVALQTDELICGPPPSHTTHVTGSSYCIKQHLDLVLEGVC